MEQFRPACKEAKGGQRASRDNKARIQTEVFGVAAETRGGGKKAARLRFHLCVSQVNKKTRCIRVLHSDMNFRNRGKVLRRTENCRDECHIPSQGSRGWTTVIIWDPSGTFGRAFAAPAAHQSSSYLTGRFFFFWFGLFFSETFCPVLWSEA